MKSKTLFSERNLLRKNTTRFGPAWILYFLGGIIIMLTAMRFEDAEEILAASLKAMPVVNLIYAFLTAQMLFGDMFNTRMCYGLHAMPMRRENRFAVNFLSGMLFSLVPHAVACLAFLMKVRFLPGVVGLWLCAMTMQYFFFFACAVFAMELTGNRFASAVVFLVINFLSIVVYWFASVVFLPMMYGVPSLDNELFLRFSPVVEMCRRTWMEVETLFEHNMNNIGVVNIGVVIGAELHYGNAWGYAGILDGIGLVMAVAAMLLYRKRDLEHAGDFAAFRAINPVFTVVFSYIGAAGMATFGSLFSNDTVIVMAFIGMILAFFISRLLIERTVKVLRARNFLALMGLLAVMLGAVIGVKFDVLGIVSFVPQAQQVESVEITGWLEDRYGSFNIHDPNAVATVTQVHRKLLEAGPDADGYYRRVELEYKLTDGRRIKREYRADEKLCKKLADCVDMTTRLLGTNSKDVFMSIWENGQMSLVSYGVWYHVEPDRQLADCLFADALSGKLIRDGNMTDRGVHLSMYSTANRTGRDIWFAEDSLTFAYLINHTEYADGFLRDPSFLRQQFTLYGVFLTVGEEKIRITACEPEELVYLLLEDMDSGLICPEKAEDALAVISCPESPLLGKKHWGLLEYSMTTGYLMKFPEYRKLLSSD